MNNAIQHAPGSPIEVRLLQSTDVAMIEVEDRGPGIAAEDLDQVFTRFYRGTVATTSQVRGLGLGLYIVREIVAAHGGTVHVRSTLGRGSTFTVRLPLQRDPRQSEEP